MMRVILTIICLLFLSVVVQAQPLQADSSSVVGYNPEFVAQADITNSSDLGSETYSIVLQNRSELLGHFSYVASNAIVGDIIVDGNGGIYEIRTITFPNATVKLLNDPLNLPEPYFGFAQAPVSPIIIARPVGDMGLIPIYPFLGTGIDPRLVAVISNYNAQQINSTGGGASSADQISITDAGSYYPGSTNVEEALQDVGQSIETNAADILEARKTYSSYTYVSSGLGSTIVLPTTPRPTDVVVVYRNGMRQTVATSGTAADVTISGTTLTLNYRPFETGEIFLILYIEQ